MARAKKRKKTKTKSYGSGDFLDAQRQGGMSAVKQYGDNAPEALGESPAMRDYGFSSGMSGGG